MKKQLIIVLLLFLSGCVFYEKVYVSRVELEGESYPGGDEGDFYIDNDPLISMWLGCAKSTKLSQSVTPLVPVPVPVKAEPHHTLSEEQFYLSLRHKTQDKIDLSELEGSIEIANERYKLNFWKKEQGFFTTYQFDALLRCKQINDGILRLKLSEDKMREYKIQFKEGVERRVNYQLDFVT